MVHDGRAPAASQSILLVEDDADLCSLMSDFFAQNGFQLETRHDGPGGLARALEARFDLILLDVMLPNLDGFEILKQIRRRSAVPVIMLTARTEQRDRIAGLDGGADDYLPKPFAPHELLARVRAVLRRSAPGFAVKSDIISVGDIKLNPQTREVWNNRQPVEITSIEFDILDLLMRSAGRVVSRDELASVLYQREATPFERAIDVHISHLRKKLEAGGRVVIRSVRGVGYLFTSSEPEGK